MICIYIVIYNCGNYKNVTCNMTIKVCLFSLLKRVSMYEFEIHLTRVNIFLHVSILLLLLFIFGSSYNTRLIFGFKFWLIVLPIVYALARLIDEKIYFNFLKSMNIVNLHYYFLLLLSRDQLYIFNYYFNFN